MAILCPLVELRLCGYINSNCEDITLHFVSVMWISFLVHHLCSNTILDAVYFAIQIVHTNCHLLWIMTLQLVFTNQRAEFIHAMQQNGVHFVLIMVCMSCSP